jgi:hypothetical protein
MVVILHSGFWLQEPKKPKGATLCILDPENFGILDETKNTHEKFSILHFIISKYLVFYILHSIGN